MDFKRYFLVLIFLFISVTLLAEQKSEILFFDDFNSYQNGANGSPVWTISKGFWFIKDGKFIQKSTDYDCGAMIDLFLDFSFELKFKFRVKEGEPGAGFFFHSKELGSTEFSHMSRFESQETMLVGRFIQGGYECSHSVRFNKQKFSGWHWLTLRVNQDKKSYSIFLDKEPLTLDEPLFFPAGYCGIQSSGGVIEFDDVTLSRLPMKGQPAILSWLNYFILNKKGQLVVPTPSRGKIYIIDQKGKFRSSFGAPIKQKGQFASPCGIAQLQSGDYVISDSKLNRIHLFSDDGEWKKTVGGTGKGNAQFDQPGDIAVDEHDRIYVVDHGNKRIQIFDKKLNFLLSFGKEELELPEAIAIRGDTIYVLNNGINRIEVFLWQGKQPVRTNYVSFGSGVGRDLVVDLRNIYVSLTNEIRLFDKNGNLIKRFFAESIGGIYPYGMAVSKQGRLYLSDYFQGNLIVTDKKLSESVADIEFPDNGTAVFKIDVAEKKLIKLRISLNNNVIFEKKSPAGVHHQFTIKGLTPSTTYHYQIYPTFFRIPGDRQYSKKFPFITPPEPGKKHYRAISMATIIFTNVLDTATMESGQPPLPELPEAELDRIKAQIEDGIRFYWLNSGMNLFIDNKFLVINEHLYKHQLFGPEWWYPPLKKSIKKYVKKAGYKITDFQSILYLACVRDYNKEKNKYELRGKGGGFTAGLGANNQYGLSYWEVTHENHNSGNNWLMVHEFHHQLDELFLLSGYPEYWFNHFSPTIFTAADFGEHFDGNAWILRNWQPAKWYDLKFGKLRFTVDQDMDGIPDDDPDLPMDEKRFGSSPFRKDDDQDGISDFDEIFFSNWVIEGCGETYGGVTLFPNPLDPDTDHDGIIDSEDPYPLYPFKPEIHYGKDEEINPIDEPQFFFAKLLDRRIHARVYALWDSVQLHFVFKTDRLAPVKLMLDVDADGWFLGRDNYLITAIPENDSTLNASVSINNCSLPDRWPFMDKTLSEKIQLRSKLTCQKGRYFIDIIVPKNDFTGLELKSGEQIGVNIGFKVIMDADGHQRYVTIFEPNRFFDVRLSQ